MPDDALERRARALDMVGFREDIPRIKVVRLRQKSEENTEPNLIGTGLRFDRFYLILGEVGRTRHYLIMERKTHQIMPGMFHLERFEEVPDDDL